MRFSRDLLSVSTFVLLNLCSTTGWLGEVRWVTKTCCFTGCTSKFWKRYRVSNGKASFEKGHFPKLIKVRLSWVRWFYDCKYFVHVIFSRWAFKIQKCRILKSCLNTLYFDVLSYENLLIFFFRFVNISFYEKLSFLLHFSVLHNFSCLKKKNRHVSKHFRTCDSYCNFQ